MRITPMQDTPLSLPSHYPGILAASEALQFSMPSDLQTGSMLRTLVASRPGGRFLELGTGTGLSLSWIVEGMDEQSTVISIDTSETYLSVARDHFGSDPRVSLLCSDGAAWIEAHPEERFDLIFADAWPGKYEKLEEALSLLKKGAFYVIDDMRPQPNWPAGHEDNVARLLDTLSGRKDLYLTAMNWSTGVLIAVKR